MEVFSMVVMIVLISCGAGVMNNYLKNRRLESHVDMNDEALAELDALRARVEVLEEIVTDSKHQLARELDQLERQA